MQRRRQVHGSDADTLAKSHMRESLGVRLGVETGGGGAALEGSTASDLRFLRSG